MAQFYKPRLVCIARCKNEIHIIKKWYESLPFVDVFVITDNNSTDGTYEYLKSLPNVIVIRLEEFDEGRDFQILLKVAKSLKPEWLLKIDCDEIFEDIGIKNMHKLLEQKKYNAVFFRKYNFDYLAGDNHYVGSPSDWLQAQLYLARSTKSLNILNKKSHVGDFQFYSKPVLSNFRIKHYPKSSPEKCREKYETYMKMKLDSDKMQDYSRLIDNSKERIERIEKSKKLFPVIDVNPNPSLDRFGLNCINITGNSENIIYPIKNKQFFRFFVKNIVIKLIDIFKMTHIFMKARGR